MTTSVSMRKTKKPIQATSALDPMKKRRSPLLLKDLLMQAW